MKSKGIEAMRVSAKPKPAGWAISDESLRVVHPINDSRPHDLTYELENGDLTLHCWCRPDYKDGVIIHHSRDGREDWERPQ